MKKNLNVMNAATLSVVACLVLGISQAHAGSEGSGGGHGVPDPDGTIEFLDLLDQPQNAYTRDINIFEAPETAQAAQMAVDALSVLSAKYPNFTQDFISTLHEMKWSLSNVPLKPISDTGLNLPEEVVPLQVAEQDIHGHVTVYDKAIPTTVENRAALILHEGTLAKLGKAVSRDAVRAFVKALLLPGFDDATRIVKVEQALNPLSPNILPGKFEVAIVLAPAPATAVAAIVQTQINGVRQHFKVANFKEKDFMYCGVDEPKNPLPKCVWKYNFQTSAEIKRDFLFAMDVMPDLQRAFGQVNMTSPGVNAYIYVNGVQKRFLHVLGGGAELVQGDWLVK